MMRKSCFSGSLLFGLWAFLVLLPEVSGASSSKPSKLVPDGTWVSRGYGWVLKSLNGELKAYEETAISCLLNQDLLDAIEDIQVRGNVLFVSAGGITTYVFDKAAQPSGFCAQGTTPTKRDDDYTRDALLVFDIVVQTFAENYAYFDLRGIDWEALTSPVREGLTPESTDEELFAAFTFSLLPLDDDSGFVASKRFGVQKQFPLVIQLKKEFEDQDTIRDLGVYVNTQLRRWIQIVDKYMEGYLIGEVGGLLWGHFKNANVGYMQIMSLDPPDDDDFFANVESALRSFKDKDAIVLDVRAVEGDGDDDIPMILASYFASEPVPAFTKRAVQGDGYTDTIVHSIEPGDAEIRFDGQVVVIASGSTVGSSEIFTLSMAQLPQTTILGRNTSGAIGASDRLERILPNGWVFGLANHRYTALDGTTYEKVGFPPDVTTGGELLPLHEREVGIDSWLELALDLVDKKYSWLESQTE